MNKLKNTIKLSSVMLVLAGLIAVGVASAALVNYLSDKVEATATVGSPIVMNINDGRDGTVNTNKTLAIDTVGGDNFTFTTVAKNNANDVITGYRVVVLKSQPSKAFTGGEVVKIAMEWGNNTSSGGDSTTNIIAGISVVNADGSLTPLTSWTGSSTKLVLTNGATTDIAGDDAEWNAFTVKLNQAIEPGTYRVSSEFVIDLATYAASVYGI